MRPAGGLLPFLHNELEFSATRMSALSKADIVACPSDVRFTPKSGHWLNVLECPLSAKSGHSAPQQMRVLLGHQARAIHHKPLNQL